MKKSKFFLCLFATLFCSNILLGQVRLVSASVSFVTPGHTEDKDYDSKVKVTLHNSSGVELAVSGDQYNTNTSPVNGTILSVFFCCQPPVKDPHNSNIVLNPGTVFVDNGIERGPFKLNIENNGVLQQDIKNGYIKIKISPNGHDRWVFASKLTLGFSDGTSKVYQFANTIIEQDAPVTYLVFPN